MSVITGPFIKLSTNSVAGNLFEKSSDILKKFISISKMMNTTLIPEANAIMGIYQGGFSENKKKYLFCR